MIKQVKKLTKSDSVKMAVYLYINGQASIAVFDAWRELKTTGMSDCEKREFENAVDAELDRAVSIANNTYR